MPTDLPRGRRKPPHSHQAALKPKPTLFGMMLNSFMVGTVLFLFAIVLLQEKRYADGEPGSIADSFIEKAHAAIVNSDAQDDGAPSSN